MSINSFPPCLFTSPAQELPASTDKFLNRTVLTVVCLTNTDGGEIYLGVKKGRTYTLSPRVYRELGQSADYVRQAGFDSIQQEQMVLSYVNTHGKITRLEAIELCRISEDQASRLLRRLTDAKRLKLVGQRRGAHYVLL